MGVRRVENLVESEVSHARFSQWLKRTILPTTKKKGTKFCVVLDEIGAFVATEVAIIKLVVGRPYDFREQGRFKTPLESLGRDSICFIWIVS